MIKIRRIFLVFIAWMLSVATMAQITGETCIATDGTIYLYEVDLGGKSFNQTSAEVTTWGGIEVVSVDREQNKILIKSKQGTTKEEYFSKFGKGRIWVTYQDGGCGNWISFDVSKSFDMQNDNEYGYTIVSPSCISAGDTMTVAVTPLVTMAFPHSPMERYKWSFPNGLIREVLFAAVDSSSITFVAGQIGTIETISVKLGQCNFTNPNNLLTRKVYKAPPRPKIVGNECIKNGEQAIYRLLPASTSDVAYYRWYIGTDKVVDSVPANYELNLNDFDKFKNMGELMIRVEANPLVGNCMGFLVDTIMIKKGFSEEKSSIVSKTNTCLSVGQQAVFEIGNNLNSTVVWTMPDESGIKTEEKVGNASLLFTVPAINKLSEQIKVYVKDVSCTDILLYNFNIKPGKVDSVSGARTIFTDSIYTYTVQGTLMPTVNKGYEWVLPAGLEELSKTHNSITVKVKSERASLTPFTVTAIGNQDCNSEVTNIVVGYEPQPVGEITASTSCFNINMPTSVSFSVVPIAGHSFVWTVDSKLGVFDTHTNGNVLSGTVLGTPGTYKVTCQSKSGNNISTHTETFNVNIVDNYEMEVLEANSSLKITLSSLNGGNLFIPVSSVDIKFSHNENKLNATIVPFIYAIHAFFHYISPTSQKTEYYEPKVPLIQGDVLEVTYTMPIDSNGCVRKLYKKVVGTAPADNQGASTNSSRSNNFESKRSSENRTLIFDENLFDLYPNPTDEFVNVSMKQYDSSINTDVEIYNMDGKIVYKEKIKNSYTKINISQLKSATYIMLIKTNSALKMDKFIKN